MATVWRVEGPGGGIHALKEMRPQQEAKREMMRRFKQEFEVTAAIDHRNIVSVREFFEAQKTLHIVMEWVDGPDLRDVLRYGGRLDAGRLALVGSEIAAGLAAAHSQGILHRDLKPENILMTQRGQVKITDFGVARVMGTRLTKTGIIVGSPAYMSPEQLAGVSGQKLSTGSDSYSLGVLLYELGEARDPLGLKKHEDLLTVLRTKREKKPRKMRHIEHQDLRELILACLEPEEEDRPQDMEEIARRLRRVARAESVRRENLEFLTRAVLENRAAKKRAGGAAAPLMPKALPTPPKASKPAPPTRRPPSSKARPTEKLRGRDRLRKNSEKRRKSSPPKERRPSQREVTDFGHTKPDASRVNELSVKRKGGRTERVSLLSWLVLIVLGLGVVLLAASFSLTDSPLGLLEELVPLP